MKGFKRYLVQCKKCGYEWLARTENPLRCALCNNPNINKPKVRQTLREKNYGQES